VILLNSGFTVWKTYLTNFWMTTREMRSGAKRRQTDQAFKLILLLQG
jgi:hypothetical protein